MRQLRSALAAWLMVVFILRFAYASADPREYPFSDMVDWNDEEKRKDYEKYLALADISIRYLRVEHPDTKKRWARNLYFMILERRGATVGFGAAFYDLVLPGTAVHPNDYEVILRLNRAEIIYDIYGRQIFLISYRKELSAGHKIIWFFLPDSVKARYLKKYKMEAERHIFGWGELGEGYALDERSQEYARFLIYSPVFLKPFFDKEKPEVKTFQVPFDRELFQKLSP